MPRSEKLKSTDRLSTHSWTSHSACTRGPEKQQREQVPESVQREQVPESVCSVSELERRNTEVETILKGMFPLIDSVCLREVISSSQVIPYNQAQGPDLYVEGSTEGTGNVRHDCNQLQLREQKLSQGPVQSEEYASVQKSR